MRLSLRRGIYQNDGSKSIKKRLRHVCQSREGLEDHLMGLVGVVLGRSLGFILIIVHLVIVVETPFLGDTPTVIGDTHWAHDPTGGWDFPSREVPLYALTNGMLVPFIGGEEGQFPLGHIQRLLEGHTIPCPLIIRCTCIDESREKSG